MCGIWAYFRRQGITSNQQLEDHTLQYLKECYGKINHRGPDCSSFHHVNQHLILGFHRLAIIDPSCTSDQPLASANTVLVCNGEIFNYKSLMSILDYQPRTGSDCEVIQPLYEKYGIAETCRKLDAEFAFAIYDKKKRQLHISRDRYGVRPLFWAVTRKGEVFLSSEAKGIPAFDLEFDDETSDEGYLIKVEPFPPGHYATITLGDQSDLVTREESGEEMGLGAVGDIDESSNLTISTPVPYFSFPSTAKPLLDLDLDLDSGLQKAMTQIRRLLTQSVQKRLMSDRPLGCLLSGGLDSSLVTSITVRSLPLEMVEKFHCFSIGLEGSVDLVAAKKVAEHLGIKHHHVVNFSVQEGLEALEEVIHHLESYDVTTIRASVPQYLLAKYVATQTPIRVLLSGEGADELFGGYQYFKNCPDPESLRLESRRLLSELYLFDNLRTDRTTAAHGLEVRVPFLDHGFVDYVDSLPPEYRMCGERSETVTQEGNYSEERSMEKWVLRESFDDRVEPYLPSEILWRRKEAFSDAVSSHTTSWYETLVNHITDKMTDQAKTSVDAILEKGQNEYPFNPPQTLEALYYRTIFEKYHGGRANLISHYWMPKWVTLASWDPSATKLECHQGDLSKEKILSH